MRTSRSSIRWWVLVAILALGASVAYAGGRKRIVVLEFEGPHAEKFHDDLVKILKKSNTVVPTDKWNGTAEELDAATVTEKNVKKVAKKLKIDGVVTGKIEKRRDEYIVRLKLRAGTSGEIVGNPVDTKADGPHLDGKAARDIKDELVGAIDELEANHGGGGDDDEADDSSSKKKAKKVAAADDDSGDDAPAKSKKKKKKAADDDDAASSDDDSGKHGAFSKHADKGGDKVGKKGSDDDDAGDDSSAKAKKKKTASADDDDSASSAKAKKKKAADDDDSASSAKAKKASSDDDDSASSAKAKKKAKSDDDTASSDDDESSHRKAKKKVAKGDDDENSTSAEASADEPGSTVADPLAPTERAIDAAVGLSFIARHLSFSYSSALAGPQIPPGYKQSVPVAGGYVDALVFPFDINHNRTDALSHLGIEFMYNRVLRISSQKDYTNATTNMTATATLATVSESYGLGAVYRYALGKIALGGRLMYENQSFLIGQSLPDGSATDIPDVQYSMVEIGGYMKYPLMPKIQIDVDAGFLGVLSAGNSQYYIGNGMEYGKASTYGFQLAAGGEYQLTKNIFLRAQLSLEEISMKFANNSATLANTRDGDGTTQDVFSAKDLYYGGMVTAGYAY